MTMPSAEGFSSANATQRQEAADVAGFLRELERKESALRLVEIDALTEHLAAAEPLLGDDNRAMRFLNELSTLVTVQAENADLEIVRDDARYIARALEEKWLNGRAQNDRRGFYGAGARGEERARPHWKPPRSEP
jgi:hypothetical protein